MSGGCRGNRSEPRAEEQAAEVHTDVSWELCTGLLQQRSICFHKMIAKFLSLRVALGNEDVAYNSNQGLSYRGAETLSSFMEKCHTRIMYIIIIF